jgi:hypothetical protein
MPLKKGASRKTISTNIRELKAGPQFERTSRNFGVKTARKQAVAIALDKARKSGKKGR